MTEYTMGLPLSDGIVWMYTGFTKTFGYLGIAAAFIFTARRENRAPYRRRYDPAGGHGLGGLHHRTH